MTFKRLSFFTYRAPRAVFEISHGEYINAKLIAFFLLRAILDSLPWLYFSPDQFYEIMISQLTGFLRTSLSPVSVLRVTSWRTWLLYDQRSVCRGLNTKIDHKRREPRMGEVHVSLKGSRSSSKKRETEKKEPWIDLRTGSS